MLSATVGTASAPAGLFQSAAIAPTTGGGLAAMLGDVEALFTALAQNGAGANIVLVAPLPAAAVLKAQLSPLFNWPILASTAMPLKSIGAIDLTSFVAGFRTEVEFDVSTVTALAMDTAPGDISGAPLVKSGFQIEMLALRASMFISWTMRTAAHAQLISGCSW